MWKNRFDYSTSYWNWESHTNSHSILICWLVSLLFYPTNAKWYRAIRKWCCTIKKWCTGDSSTPPLTRWSFFEFSHWHNLISDCDRNFVRYIWIFHSVDKIKFQPTRRNVNVHSEARKVSNHWQSHNGLKDSVSIEEIESGSVFCPQSLWVTSTRQYNK